MIWKLKFQMKNIFKDFKFHIFNASWDKRVSIKSKFQVIISKWKFWNWNAFTWTWIPKKLIETRALGNWNLEFELGKFHLDLEYFPSKQLKPSYLDLYLDLISKSNFQVQVPSANWNRPLVAGQRLGWMKNVIVIINGITLLPVIKYGWKFEKNKYYNL